MSPAKRLTALDMVCPTCVALVGNRCHQLDGSGPTSPHPSRRKLAREENERRFPVHCPGQLDLFPAAAKGGRH